MSAMVVSTLSRISELWLSTFFQAGITQYGGRTERRHLTSLRQSGAVERPSRTGVLADDRDADTSISASEMYSTTTIVYPSYSRLFAPDRLLPMKLIV